MATNRNSQYGLPAPASYHRDDIFIAVMGVTGSGKTTFIGTCCPDAAGAAGHTLHSETKDVQLYTMKHNGRRIHLIDTPGFDDTIRSDADVLQTLAFWLTRSYKDKIRLTGIIYLHRITDVKMSGSAYKNLRTFQKMCGKQSMSAVVLATTMWSDVTPENGDRREMELCTSAHFWGNMIKEGSKNFRHMNNRESAVKIISHFMYKDPVTLELQTEMVLENQPLDNTEAGREVEGELRKQREQFERRLQQTQTEMNEALAQNDRNLANKIAEEQAEWRQKIEKVEKGREELRVTMEQLIKDKEAEYQKDKETFDKKIREQEELRKKADEEFEKWKEEKRRKEEEMEKESQKQQEQLNAAREEIEKADVEKVAYLMGAVQAIKEEQELRRREKEDMLREMEAREAAARAREDRLLALQRQRDHDASYQASWYRAQQMAYQQPYVAQQHYGSQTSGMMAGAAMGGLMATMGQSMAASMACNVM